MSARDDYPADGAIGGTAELRDGLYDRAMDEIDRLRDKVADFEAERLLNTGPIPVVDRPDNRV